MNTEVLPVVNLEDDLAALPAPENTNERRPSSQHGSRSKRFHRRPIAAPKIWLTGITAVSRDQKNSSITE
jgi:hypothetical protein